MDTTAFLGKPLQQTLRQMAKQPGWQDHAEIASRNKRVQAALMTLTTHTEAGEAWTIVLEDLIYTTLLHVVLPEGHSEAALLMHEGKRQLVLQLLLAIQTAVGEKGE